METTKDQIIQLIKDINDNKAKERWEIDIDDWDDLNRFTADEINKTFWEDICRNDDDFYHDGIFISAFCGYYSIYKYDNVLHYSYSDNYPNW